MKKLLFTLLVFALALPLAAAEVPQTTPAPAASAPVKAADPPPAAEASNLAKEDFLATLQDSGLMVPDAVPAQPPPCPVSVACTSPIGPCAMAINCTVTDIGPCCMTTGGFVRCCTTGSIKVTKCPCAGPGCPSAHVSSMCG